ncbi:conserved protein of unknown function [Xenorhabdus poinarii G6]|uniref:Uncharacterized protein n=1 Tax=Xenorhabdus poinarii G6 TaxID=1354304 RepID=A0A068R038_9GAMM|nr:hypothetical protein [Xenorhabdus poinarii]CDG20657.1 conserved protein of unknown function [Xenorhabdus poinarii G6]
MIIKTHLLRSVLALTDKKDIRTYCQGIHITSKHIEATDGRAILRLEHGEKYQEDTDIFVIFRTNKIPKEAINTELNFSNNFPAAWHRDTENEFIGRNNVDVVQYEYPNISRHTDATLSSKKSNAIPYIHVRYLNLLSKIFPEKEFAVQLEPTGMASVCRFKFTKEIKEKYGNPDFIVMPVRVKE